jgi:peptide/nickel transport system permease protein
MKFIVRRAGQALFTIWLVVSFTFVLIRKLPGGPVSYLRAQLIASSGGSLTAKERQQLVQLAQTYININPDKPVWKQYLNYLGSLAQGDFGQSIWYHAPVADLIAQTLPWTLLIAAITILWSFSTGIALGTWMAYREGSKTDLALSSAASLTSSIPYYVVAVLAVYILAYQLGWFPTGGHTSGTVPVGFTLAYLTDVLYHAALPVLSFAIPGLFGRSLGMRANSIRVMGEDFLRVARLRGLSESRIALHYVGRNAILPMYTGFLLAIGTIFGGAVILEQIFTYRGAGMLLLQGINHRDYPLMMGMFIILTVGIVLGMFIADLTYGKLDPRIETGERSR